MRSAALLFCLLATGCAASLREPPPLSANRDAADSLDVLRQRAQQAFDCRTVEDVRLAAASWLAAAEAEPDSVDALVELARARLWLVEHLAGEADREAESTRAVHAAQWCGQRLPEDPRCAYWLGVTLGVQARERRSTALDALPRIVTYLQAAAAAEPTMEHAGPDRVLALLYLRSPGWPRGPGDPELGLEHARRAVDIDGDYPPNLFALAEALDASGGDAAGIRSRARELVDFARKEGVAEATDWPDPDP